MRVLFATAELAPVARVGGMAEASAGLVKQLRADGVEVQAVLPDYGSVPLDGETVTALAVPEWVGSASVRSGLFEGNQLSLVSTPGLAKPHPYTDINGMAFSDNDRRFFGFSAAIAAMVEHHGPDVLHLNDWHTAASLGFLADAPPSLLTIHTLGYQGVSGGHWLEHIVTAPELFTWYGDINPLLGGIRLADRVLAVSPNYAREILSVEHGMGLHEHLVALGPRLRGVVNGIDVAEWNSAEDQIIPARFKPTNMRGKAVNRQALLAEFGLSTDDVTPVIGLVTRLVEQKGVDLVIEAARYLEGLPAKLVVLGSGDKTLALGLDELAARFPNQVAFRDGYDLELAHLIFAGADLFAMPSRFEPCGLAQMQAMAYGTIPVVTNVGGLVDTVIDADQDPENGNGFVAQTVDVPGLVDGLHRAVRAWSDRRRRSAIRKRGMTADWSWSGPAAEYEQIYRELVTG